MPSTSKPSMVFTVCLWKFHPYASQVQTARFKGNDVSSAGDEVVALKSEDKVASAGCRKSNRFIQICSFKMSLWSSLMDWARQPSFLDPTMRREHSTICSPRWMHVWLAPRWERGDLLTTMCIMRHVIHDARIARSSSFLPSEHAWLNLEVALVCCSHWCFFS